MSGIKVGDWVRVQREYRHDPGQLDGATGTVVALDPEDSAYPFEVRIHGRPHADWVHSVEHIEPNADTSRETLVTRARELLTGTDHTGADVVAMAHFLAGGDDETAPR
ncbi:hypothetical protein [Streptomyces sp. CAU 1734]|uniref:hypothetical protein n=1 Tax=Streptomyces sp. CAU 1734 TaxID=3140360 RepID=UPI003260F642